jgi:hypothetical protein
MAKRIRDNRKTSRGRPATGKSPMVSVRMHEEMQDLINNWAAKQTITLRLPVLFAGWSSWG